MAFPQTPLSITVKLRISGVLTDVTTHVQGLGEGEGGVFTWQYGAPDERAESSTRTLTLSFKNWADASVSRVAGQFSTDNPRSPHYQQLGESTEVQILVGSDIRFAGRINAWRPVADETGNVMIMVATAVGALGRLSQGAQALKSPLRRASLFADPLVYLPMEQGSDSLVLTSGLSGGPSVTPSGPFGFGSGEDLAGSDALAKPDLGSRIRIPVPAFASTWSSATDGWSVTWVMNIPAAPASTVTLISWVCATGTIRRGAVQMNSSGQVVVVAYNSAGTELLADTPTSLGSDNSGTFFGRWLTWNLTMIPVGADTTIEAARWVVGPGPDYQGAGFGNNPVATGILVSQPESVEWAQVISDTSVGHLAIFSDQSTIGPSVAYAHVNEQAATRIERICTEEDIPLTLINHSVDMSTSMGEQSRGTALEVIRECERADLGILFETRDDPDGLTYIARTRLYNQLPVIELDYSANHLSEPFDPTRDDQTIENIVTVSRDGGGQHTAILESGPLSIQDPPDGVGPYDRGGRNLSLARDAQAKQVAYWLRGLGTNPTGRVRIPTLTLELHRSVFATNATLTNQVKALNVGSALTLSGLVNTRQDMPPDMMLLQMRGGTESISRYSWTISPTVIPGWPWEAVQLDTNLSTVVKAAAAGVTTLVVDMSTTSGDFGPPWSETVPYYAIIDGEAVKVTAVSTNIPGTPTAGAVSHGDNASLTPAVPAGSEGDAMYLVAVIRNTAASVSTPTGWTLVYDASNLKVFGKYASSAESSPTVSFTGGAAGDTTTAVIMRCTGSSIRLDRSNAQTGGVQQNVDYPALKWKRLYDLQVLVAWKQDDSTGFTVATDMTELVDASTTTGNDQSLAIDYVVRPAPDTAIAGTLTVSGGATAIAKAIQLTFRPTQSMIVERSINLISKTLAVGKSVHGYRLGVVGL